MATVLNLSGLTEAVENRREELFVQAAVGAKTLDYVELMLNVKKRAQLNYLSSDVLFQEAQCGWNPNGSDTFSEKYVDVIPLEIEKEWCYLDFKDYWLNYELRFAAGRETLPKEEALIKSNQEAIKAALETMLWQGNSGLSFSGFIAQIESEGTTENVGSGSTATDKIDAAVAAANAQMLAKGVNVFVSLTDFRNYVLESNGTCCANRPILDAASESITYAGDSRVTIIPVMGLEGTGVVVAASKDALVYATDIEGSEAIYRLWFNEDEQKFKFRVLFNAGTAIKFPNEVVIVEEGE